MGEQTMDVDFKSQFYNLQGTHINQRKKNFNRLLNSASPHLSQDEIDIQPRNYQEKIFYVDVLIHFRQVEKLTEILKEGNMILTSKILKQKWFFHEAFNNIKEEDIVKKFLPSLSYSLRLKVLKKLSLMLSEERMDQIYDLVLERYGLCIAKQFLFSCSPQKIINILRNNEILLSTDQLKRILQKDIELLKVYFEEYKKITRTDFHDSRFLSYLAWKHPNLYFELGLHDKTYIKLGHHTTRTVIKTNKAKVLNDIQNSRWNKAALVKEVKEFDREYLFKFFPKSIDLISHHSYSINIVSFVTKYPIKKRWDILAQAFQQAYKEPIIDHLGKFETKLAVFFPREIQQKWAETKYSESKNLLYIKFFDPKKAFPLLKDKINVTSDITQRGSFLNELITVCLKNEDYSTFEAVLKYICLRHRNDDKNVRTRMMSYLELSINYNLLTINHWQYINELIDFQRVREEVLPFTIICKYLLFVHKENQSLVEPLTQYVKDSIAVNRNSLRLLSGCKEAERDILKHIVKILPTLELSSENRDNYDVIILSDIIDFNRDIKNDKALNKDFQMLWIDLNEFPSIMDFIQKVCTKEKMYYNNDDYVIVGKIILYNCMYSENPLKVIDENGLLALIKTMSTGGNEDRFNNCILEVIKKRNRTQFENNLLDCYFNNMYKHCVAYLRPDVIEYFLTNEPEVIAKYYGYILSIDTDKSYNMLDYDIIKKYSHLELDKQLILRFKDLVVVNAKYDKKPKILKALSSVMDAKDFLDLVKDYTPDAKKLDLENKEQREIYQLQCDIAKIFKKLDEPSRVAPIIMHYAQGDYLQSSLSTLYRALYRINEAEAFNYIKVLGNRAVSARKHAVFLAFEVLPVKDAMNVYSEITSIETNISAKKYQFDSILKYFLKVRLEPLLDIVFKNMEFIDKHDTELIHSVIGSVNKIPNINKPLFIEKVWNFLDILDLQDVKVVNHRNNALCTINEHGVSFICRLHEIFCVDLINKYFLPIDKSLNLDNIDYFVINYLLTYFDEQHFEHIFNIIKNYKNIFWESKDAMDIVFRFFTNTYKKFEHNDLKFVKLFTKFWQHFFTPEETFSEYILLRIMVLFKENMNIEVFSTQVDKFFQELLQKHGPYIGEFLINSIKTFFGRIDHNTEFNIRNYVLFLLSANFSDFNYYAAYSISKNLPEEDGKNIFSKIVGTLKPADNSAVSIYCNMLQIRVPATRIDTGSPDWTK